jgi:hypothetical protein
VRVHRAEEDLVDNGGAVKPPQPPPSGFSPEGIAVADKAEIPDLGAGCLDDLQVRVGFRSLMSEG